MKRNAAAGSNKNKKKKKKNAEDVRWISRKTVRIRQSFAFLLGRRTFRYRRRRSQSDSETQKKNRFVFPKVEKLIFPTKTFLLSAGKMLTYDADPVNSWKFSRAIRRWWFSFVFQMDPSSYSDVPRWVLLFLFVASNLFFSFSEEVGRRVSTFAAKLKRASTKRRPANFSRCVLILRRATFFGSTPISERKSRRIDWFFFLNLFIRIKKCKNLFFAFVHRKMILFVLFVLFQIDLEHFLRR